MKFTKTGNFEGDAELFIDGKSVGKTHIDQTVSITYSIEETFDVGEDTGSPIIEDVYAVPFRFEHLDKLTVKVGTDGNCLLRCKFQEQRGRDLEERECLPSRAQVHDQGWT